MPRPRRLSPPVLREAAVSSKDLIYEFLGLEASDGRLPVAKVSDKIFEDYCQRQWSLTYVDGGVVLCEQSTGQELKASHLSDLVVFYSGHEFSLYLRKVDNE